MEKIKLTFLGTGSAVPTAKRNHTAILLTYKNENILIDCGEGTQRQFRYAKLSPSKISKILITHWHGDHILGLPGLFQTLHMNDYSNELEIYGPRKTEYFMDLLSNLAKIKIKTKIKEISGGKIFENSEFYLQAESMQHDTPALAYSFVIKEKLRLDRKKLAKLKLPNSPILKDLQEGKDITYEGKKIKSKEVSYIEPARKVTIILDTLFNEKAIELAKDSDLLVCESSFSKEESALAKERKHLTSIDAATIAKKSKSKVLVLTHISQRYDYNNKIILDEAKKIFKNTRIVKDLDKIEI
ncbi:MAG: ribonuclease Z [Nanoarchaeota archaeon]|nr:ribonuclease Z [Nanoarchaeota archaeon]